MLVMVVYDKAYDTRLYYHVLHIEQIVLILRVIHHYNPVVMDILLYSTALGVMTYTCTAPNGEKCAANLVLQ